MLYNQTTSPKIATYDGTVLEVVEDFRYLVENTEKDVRTRNALVWQACNSMAQVWKSSLHNISKESIRRGYS